MIIAEFAAVAVLGYLLGSIPFGVLIARKKAGVDVRQYGSGRMGMSNVLRTAGGKAAGLVLVLDMAKGALAVIFAGLIIGKGYVLVGGFPLGLFSAQVIAALAAIVGHIWPVFLKFKGGRGVATFFGGLIAICPVAGAFGSGVLIISALMTRYMSLGSIAGTVGAFAILVPLTIIKGFPVEYLIYSLAGVIIIVMMHRDNITRLLEGRERRLGDRAE